jgi:hypothetical protein
MTDSLAHTATTGQRAPRPAAGPEHSPPVIYIAGSGRSGSTLLERTIGAIPGFVNVGELIDLSRRTVSRGERCGCGQAFTECDFWHQVGDRAFGGWDAETLANIRRLQFRVARQRHMGRLVAVRLAGQRFQADLASYGASYTHLYHAIAAVNGASYVVDASKWPAQALALARGGVDMRVIHLVRDVRGVAYSLGKQDIARPHAGGQPDVMVHSGAASAAAKWVTHQLEVESLRRCGVRVTRARYEDFVREPRRTVEAALDALGLAYPADGLGHIGAGTLMLGPSHGLSGNPVRFSDGDVTLRADTAWRERMGSRDRAVVTAIGGPLLLRYGGAGARKTQRASSGG